VLTSTFTLAPVPGAIAHAGAEPVLVETTRGYTTDLDDLESKAASSGARAFLISHMRGHITDLQAVRRICDAHDIVLVEDCAHTMGAKWSGRHTGTWGKIGCFSTQTYKHMNSGEGGLLVTDDDDVCARAILFSGSYMLYEQHLVRPPTEVFERWKYQTPNFSLRMSNHAAAMLRPQLGAVAGRPLPALEPALRLAGRGAGRHAPPAPAAAACKRTVRRQLDPVLADRPGPRADRRRRRRLQGRRRAHQVVRR
jgi:dTDP-4-amino-4,6-dideoxygalactose transaminase